MNWTVTNTSFKVGRASPHFGSFSFTIPSLCTLASSKRETGWDFQSEIGNARSKLGLLEIVCVCATLHKPIPKVAVDFSDFKYGSQVSSKLPHNGSVIKISLLLFRTVLHQKTPGILAIPLTTFIKSQSKFLQSSCLWCSRRRSGSKNATQIL